jgi:hypothetical protein
MVCSRGYPPEHRPQLRRARGTAFPGIVTAQLFRRYRCETKRKACRPGERDVRILAGPVPAPVARSRRGASASRTASLGNTPCSSTKPTPDHRSQPRRRDASPAEPAPAQEPTSSPATATSWARGGSPRRQRCVSRRAPLRRRTTGDRRRMTSRVGAGIHHRRTLVGTQPAADI